MCLILHFYEPYISFSAPRLSASCFLLHRPISSALGALIQRRQTYSSRPFGPKQQVRYFLPAIILGCALASTFVSCEEHVGL